MRKKVGFKKTVAAMLAALMTFNAVNTVFAEDSVLAAKVTKEKVIQTEPQKEEVTAAAPVRELEGEVIEPEINAYNKDDGKFTVTLNGGGHSICYEIYLYNVKNLEPAVGTTKEITKIGNSATPSTTEPQWKVVRIDANGSEAKSYFDLSFEQLILRHDGAYGGITQGWSGVQLKVKFNMAKHTNRIGQSVTATEQGRLCLIANESPYATNLAMQTMMQAENNNEAKVSCDEIDTVMTEHNGKNGIVGYIQCNSYNCGLADYNGDGIYSNGNLEINFGKGKETLKINPNRGTYTKKNGETITGTSAKELTTKACGETTAITIPERDGYTFNGWTVTHGTGGNGSYNSSTKKYTHCTTGETGVTTLKAKWVKNGTTPTPEPTATPTQIPEYKVTVNYYKCPYMDTTKGEVFETNPNGVSYNADKPITLGRKTKCPTGYFYYGTFSATENKLIDTTANPTTDLSYSLTKNHTFNVIFMPNQSTLQVDPNGGKWKESTEVQSFTQSYGTTLDIPEPTREKYDFKEWKQEINNKDSKLENDVYTFGKNAGVTDYITAQWEAWGFKIKYERNEPSGIGKMPMQLQDNLKIESQDSIYDVGVYENAKFLGWCLAKGNWDEKTGELASVRWLKEDGTFAETETQKGEKRFDTTGYTGKVFENLASVQELVPYVSQNGEELTLVGMWTIDVDFDAEDGTNTKALEAGQHGIAPDVTFDLIDESPSLMGTEFVKWINPTQQAINNAGKSFAQTGKSISVLAMESAVQLNADSNIYKKGQTVDEGFGEDTVLSATYQYYIQYQKGDGTIIKQGMDIAGKKTYGESATLSDVPYPTTGNTEGHHYASGKTWKVVSDNSERYKYADATNYPKKNYSNTYKQGQTALVNRSVILRAVEEANTYTLKYHANNTAASTKSLQDWSKMKDQKIIYGESVILTDITGSELPGYTFAGWNTKADGTGVSFSNKESSTVKSFLTKAGADVNEDGAVVNLYAQWKANTYTITFDVNRPSAANNTHASSNAPVLNGTVTMEYVWDSVIANNKIEDLNIPLASLKGWHQRFGDSLWYTGNNYKEPGTAIKNGTKLGYEILGTPGNKTVYAQWEANTYYVAFGKNDTTDGGRGKVGQTSMPKQKFTYDVTQKLSKNVYTKEDEDFLYHDDSSITANERGTKHNTKFNAAYQYAWLGWMQTRTDENKNTQIQYKDEEQVSNLTDKNNEIITIYAFWNALPNITTIRKETHFDRYEGAEITMADMKAIVQANDLEDGQFAKVEIVKVTYEDGIEAIAPQDAAYLDTTLPLEKQVEDGFKAYQITYKVTDTRGMYPYYMEEKEVTYEGKILYNTPPELKDGKDGSITPSGTPTLTPGAGGEGNTEGNGGVLNGKAPKRYFFLNDTKSLTEDGVLELLSRPFEQEDLIEDPEDEAYEENQDDDLYIGHKESSFEIVNVATVKQNLANMTDDERKSGKEFSYIIKYKDIFGKTVDIPGDIHLVDSSKDEALPENREQKKIRFISDEYLDTLTGDWASGEKKEALEESLQKDGNSAEYKYEDQTRD